MCSYAAFTGSEGVAVTASLGIARPSKQLEMTPKKIKYSLRHRRRQDARMARISAVRISSWGEKKSAAAAALPSSSQAASARICTGSPASAAKCAAIPAGNPHEQRHLAYSLASDGRRQQPTLNIPPDVVTVPLYSTYSKRLRTYHG